jgi:hypothetical protein
MLAKFVQDAFAQNIGVTFAGLGKFDDALGDECIGHIATICKAKGRASHFECHANDTARLRIERHSIDEGGYRHDVLLPLTGGSTIGLSATGAWDRALPVMG